MDEVWDAGGDFPQQDADDGAGGGGGALEAGTLDGSHDTGSAGGDDSGGESGPPYTPPAVPTACGAPTVTPGAMWSAPAQRFASIGIVWNGRQAVLAFAQSTGPNAWNVTLQPLTLAGMLDGPAVILGTTMGATAPVVTISTDSQRTMACWDRAEGAFSLTCAVLAEGAAASRRGLTIAGISPSVAFGPGGWGLIYEAGPNGTGTELISRRLNDEAGAAGPAHVVATAFGAAVPYPKLAAKADGYGVVISEWATLWRFSSGFEEKEGMTLAVWSAGPTALAGRGAVFGAVFRPTDAFDGVKFRLVKDDDKSAAPAVRIDDETGGGFGGIFHVAVTGGTDSFAAVWSANAGYMGYRAVDGAGVPIGEPRQIMDLGGSSNPVTIVGVTDGFLAAGVTGSDRDGIAVVHLACP